VQRISAVSRAPGQGGRPAPGSTRSGCAGTTRCRRAPRTAGPAVCRSSPTGRRAPKARGRAAADRRRTPWRGISCWEGPTSCCVYSTGMPSWRSVKTTSRRKSDAMSSVARSKYLLPRAGAGVLPIQERRDAHGWAPLLRHSQAWRRSLSDPSPSSTCRYQRPHVTARTRSAQEEGSFPGDSRSSGCSQISATRGSVTRSRSSAAIRTERRCSPPAHTIRS
jgi:hypothetical protein